MNQVWYLIGRLLAVVQDLGELTFSVRPRSGGRRWSRLATGLTLAYAGCLILATGSAALLAGHHWFFSALSFLPALGWLLPLFLLVPLGVWARPLLLVPVHIACVALVLGVYMDPEMSLPAAVGAEDDLYVSVASLNIGSSLETDPEAFLRAESPAVLLLQEARDPTRLLSAEFLAAYPYQENHGEFFTASRFPIRGAELIPDVAGTRPIAMRCMIDCWGHEVTVYNVHLPTRQHTLVRLRGRGIFHNQIRQDLVEDLIKRQQRADYLTGLLQQEEGLLIVGGDFNLTAHSALYDQYTATLQDAFKEKGRGYGFTAPAATHNSVALWRPWLRIDYILASPQLEVTGFRTEPWRASQHLAVAATLRLR